MFFADASFLVSALLGDRNGSKAWRWWTAQRAVLHGSRLVLLEAENSIRSSVFQAKVTQRSSAEALNQLQRALLDGVLIRRELSSKRMYPAAQRLCSCYTGPEVYGTIDIIHVACALELRATHFVSFDHAQRRLAAAEGLIACP